MTDDADFPVLPSEPPTTDESASISSMYRTPTSPEDLTPPAPAYPSTPPASATAPSPAAAWPAPEARDPNAVTLRIPASSQDVTTPASTPTSNGSPWNPARSMTSPTAPSAPPAPSLASAPSLTPPTAPSGLSLTPPTAAAPAVMAPAPSAIPPGVSTPAPAAPAAKGRSFGKWLLFGLLGLGLLAGGYFGGNLLRGDDSNADPEVAASNEVAVTETSSNESDTTTSSTEPVASVPLVIADADQEPIVAVAAALSPSVVSIADDFGGFGSGIIYDTDGNIVTNAHVVGNAQTVTVVLSTGERIEGTVVGSDAETDVAVVHVDARSDLVPAQFANSSEVQVGQMAVAIGSPFGLTQTVTAGIVSASSRPIDAQEDQLELNTVVPMIQTDAPINPGNSGGALADRYGRVIGMNTLIRTATADPTMAGNIGVGFAIPTNIFRLIADGIVAGEPVTPSVLGVTGSDPGIGEQPGALIVSVTPLSAAENAGFESEDLVVSFDGVPLSSMGDLAAVVRLSPAGTPISVQVIRDGVPVELIVELQSR